MSGPDGLSRVIARLYEAVLVPDLWPTALQAVAETVGADHAIAMIQHRDNRVVSFLSATRVDPQHLAIFGHAAAAGAMDRFLESVPPDTALPTSAVVPQATMMRTDFFNDVVRPMNGYYGAVLLPTIAPKTAGLFIACRPKSAEDYSRLDMRRLQLLAPHLAAAMCLHDRLAATQTTARQAFDILDDVAVGVMLVDRAGLPGFVNRSADMILHENDGLARDRTGLVAATAAVTRQLRRLIASAADGERLDSAGDFRLCLPRPSLRRPLVLRALPLSRQAADAAAHASSRVALFIHDPQHIGSLDERLVVTAFGLTPREARIVAMLAQGADLCGIADALGISIGTVRSHLKHAYDKTDTRRQGELIHLVLRLSA